MPPRDAEDDSRASEARDLYSKAVALEVEHKAAASKKQKSFNDPEVESLRNRLRETYERIILTDYNLALAKETDLSLWKNVFYNVISQLRAHMRKASAAKDTPSAKASLQRASNFLAKFLKEAHNFYSRLIQKIADQYHLEAKNVEYDTSKPTQKPYLIIHRCLVYLGDIYRYHKDLEGALNGEWRKAVQYYERALQLHPSNGNPHNQLAVLASMSGEEFEAVYHYLRALVLQEPFDTSRDNLSSLFDQIGQKYAVLKEPRGTSQNIAKHLVNLYMRLQGIIFTKIAMETLPALKTDFFHNLELLSEAPPADPEFGRLLLKITAINIMSLHRLSESFTDQLSRSSVQHSILGLYFGFTTVVMEMAVHSIEAGEPLFLDSISIWFEWLGLHLDLLQPGVTDKDASASLWAALANLLNHLPKDPSPSGRGLLPEERELRGLLPLQDCMPPAGPETKPEDQFLVRCLKLTAFAQQALNHVIWRNPVNQQYIPTPYAISQTPAKPRPNPLFEKISDSDDMALEPAGGPPEPVLAEYSDEAPSFAPAAEEVVAWRTNSQESRPIGSERRANGNPAPQPPEAFAPAPGFALFGAAPPAYPAPTLPPIPYEDSYSFFGGLPTASDWAMAYPPPQPRSVSTWMQAPPEPHRELPMRPFGPGPVQSVQLPWLMSTPYPVLPIAYPFPPGYEIPPTTNPFVGQSSSVGPSPRAELPNC